MPENYQLQNVTGVIRLSDMASIPFADGNADYERYKKWLASGNAPLPVTPETMDQAQARLANVVQNHMDAEVRKHYYDNIQTAASYAGDADPVFGAEGAACKAWRGSCWAAFRGVAMDVQLGNRAVPTESELIAMLPPMEWPSV